MVASKLYKPPRALLTPQQYLEQERQSDTRHEYALGIVTAMAGASWEHNQITGNLQGELYSALKGSPCVATSADLRVRVAACDRYYYPDLTVVCGTPQFEDSHSDTLLNPILIIEVLSATTETTDRGEKLHCYQTLPSLDTYLLVSQDQPLVESYQRLDFGWRYTLVRGLDGVVAMDAIGCTLALRDIYDRLAFASFDSKSETGDSD